MKRARKKKPQEMFPARLQPQAAATKLRKKGSSSTGPGPALPPAFLLNEKKSSNFSISVDYLPAKKG